MVLVDTSVWVDHWRQANSGLSQLLRQNRVVLHPFVLGELTLGVIAARTETLQDLLSLFTPRVAEHDEVVQLIERTPLWGRGIGWVDAHLLASALLDNLRLWSLDRRLAQVAQDLDVAFSR